MRCLREQPLAAFLDSVRLKNGRNFRDDFIDGIAVTRLIVPIMSSYALERMISMTEQSDVDNLLVEWILTLILHDIDSAAVRVLPVMLGPMAVVTATTVEPTRLPFPSDSIQRLPEVVPVKTLEVVRAALARLDIVPTAPIELTVREVVSRLALFQAYRPKNETHASIIATACDDKVLLVPPQHAPARPPCPRSAHHSLSSCSSHLDGCCR